MKLFETKVSKEKKEIIQKLSFINTAKLKHNFGNDMSEYIKLFKRNNADLWKKIEHKKQALELMQHFKKENYGAALSYNSSTP